ncbi:uncharacterized protein ARMOST_17405 [Armillaria ostoyae]|uniref:Uncharacterized protein n=1 Tax=Armillaria ostoyae TaxID=47428 RepID=A0A284RYW5_ARMOS|nr:uncharacterized protein ARMOST_17405 [Armillaria ostoyae]
MATITHPRTATPELTDSEIEAIFVNLDAVFNSIMLNAFLHGLYTRVVAVTLWAVASRNNCQDYRRPHFLVFTILLLYIVATVQGGCGPLFRHIGSDSRSAPGALKNKFANSSL